MALRRSPDTIALGLLDCIEEKGEATKWDLIKVLGNETQFGIWIEGFFLPEKVITERQESGHYYYKKTERGELFHRLLKSGSLIKLFGRVSGRRLRQQAQNAPLQNLHSSGIPKHRLVPRRQRKEDCWAV